MWEMLRKEKHSDKKKMVTVQSVMSVKKPKQVSEQGLEHWGELKDLFVYEYEGDKAVKAFWVTCREHCEKIVYKFFCVST